MINICSIAGEILLSVPVLPAALIHEELMTSDYIQLEWESDEYAVIPAGAYIEHKGERYSLLEPYYPVRRSDVVSKYSPQFQSRVMRWQKAFVPVYTYEDDGAEVMMRELDWTFTGTPSDAMFMVQRAIFHETGEQWSIKLGDDLPETITLSAQSATIWAILSEIAELCETEWWTNKQANYLYLSKCIDGITVDLEVGRNVKVPSVSPNAESGYCTRFYAFGSTRNVTQTDSVVQSSIVKKRLTLDPKKYPMGYKDIRGHFEKGVFVSDLKDEEVFPISLYFEDVYPSSSLQIANVRKRMRYHLDDDGNKIRKGGTDENPIYDQYAIWYFQIPGFSFSEELIIENQTLSVAFKSGKLRGREFELAYHPESKKAADKADVDQEFSVIAGEYEIMMDDSIEGFILPDDDYMIPEDGNDVTLFNIEMPDEYTDSAMTELEEKLDKEIAERQKDNKSYEFSSNPIAFYESGIDVKVGQPVKFTNDGNVLETRVLMVEKHLDYSFEQKIRVGNEVIKGARQQLRDEVKNIGEGIADLRDKEAVSAQIRRDHTRDLMITMGRYYAMEDTLKMLQGAIDGYDSAISPITIRTMAMLVGDESLQFRFTKDRKTLEPLEECPLTYDPEAKQLNAIACSLIHMTLGMPREISSEYDISEYKSWDMDEWHSEILDDDKKAYYVYAMVNRKGYDGAYALKESPMPMTTDENYYFLVGVLNAVYAGTRELVTFYGFTEVLPGQISTDVIRSADGNTYFDLARGVISGKIHFSAGSSGLGNVDGFSDALSEALLGIKVGGQNLLRNSGFTGDYLSEQLADDNVLDATSEMFNPPLVHWDADNVEVLDSSESMSGKEINIYDGGTLSQKLTQRIIPGEHYVLSLKAMGEAFTYYVGGVSDELLPSSSEWQKFTIDIIPTTSDSVFRLTNTTCRICDLQLERGTIPTAWSNNPLDNNSDRAYYEALKHLDNVLNAVTDATTTVYGGLVLTNQIHVGDYADKVMKRATGGISGTWSKDDDPFLWGGGNIGEANKAIETDGEEGANFVITHGGKAILNEAKVRGHITARSGNIGDFEIAAIDNGMYLKSDGDRGNENVSMRLSGYGLQMHAEGGIGESGAPAYRSQSTSYPTREYASIIRNEFTDTSADDDFMPAPCIALRVSAKGAKSNNNTQSGGNYAILNENGMIGGLRPATMAFTSDTLNLSAQDHTVLLTRGTTVNLPSNPQDGQEYELLCPNTDFADVIVVSSKKMYLFLDGVERTGFSIGELGGTRQVVKIVFCAADGKWFVWHHTY